MPRKRFERFGAVTGENCGTSDADYIASETFFKLPFIDAVAMAVRSIRWAFRAKTACAGVESPTVQFGKLRTGS